MKHLLKEHVECLAIEWIFRSKWAEGLAFIGGTNLRLVKNIDRFSEDLDFDCKNLSSGDSHDFTDALAAYLVNNGLSAVAKENENANLTALRRSIIFPGLLKELGLSAFAEERFLMKIEAQDQGKSYARETAAVRRCGLFFPVPVPPEGVLCAMKLSALLTRCWRGLAGAPVGNNAGAFSAGLLVRCHGALRRPHPGPRRAVSLCRLRDCGRARPFPARVVQHSVSARFGGGCFRHVPIRCSSPLGNGAWRRRV